ncbi:MAG TPA: response regulator transcription factor [Armatimonadetes bacterium]|nr:response regulator transcription factor [Armatimonadota bacterium]
MVRQHVLVVEDDDIVRRLCADLLKEMDYEVTCVVNGLSAVTRLRERAFDLVLLDLDLPGLDGYKVLELMRAGLAPQVPVVVLSAWTSEEGRRFCEGYGVLAYWEKPFDLEDLAQLLETLKRRKPTLPPQGLPEPLTAQEKAVLLGWRQGKSDKEIADRLGISPSTVEKIGRRVREKLGAKTRHEAAALSRQRDVIAQRG